MRHEFKRIEPKWQKRWEESGLHKFDPDSGKQEPIIVVNFSNRPNC